MCSNEFTSCFQFIFGLAVWGLAFIGLGSLYKVSPRKSLIYGFGIFIAVIITLGLLIALFDY
jgi:hypothetical protein